MKINELKQEQVVVVGLKLRSLINPSKIATIVRIDKSDDNYAWIQWPEMIVLIVDFMEMIVNVRFLNHDTI